MVTFSVICFKLRFGMGLIKDHCFLSAKKQPDYYYIHVADMYFHLISCTEDSQGKTVVSTGTYH